MERESLNTTYTKYEKETAPNSVSPVPIPSLNSRRCVSADFPNPIAWNSDSMRRMEPRTQEDKVTFLYGDSPLVTKIAEDIFSDEEEGDIGLDAGENNSSSYVKRYLQMYKDNDKFPVLIRRSSHPDLVMGLSVAAASVSDSSEKRINEYCDGGGEIESVLEEISHLEVTDGPEEKIHGGLVGDYPIRRGYRYSQPSDGPDRRLCIQEHFHKRAISEGEARMSVFTITEVRDQIYSLSKDQYGCRFLQRKLEEQNSENVDIIFTEIYDHLNELMIDPFGNYLCQKLIEHCNKEQRKELVMAVAKDLPKIALNMHGTRAVQKLMDSLDSVEQIILVIDALRCQVVSLIQDINGNHVIQKCLLRFAPCHNQFIYDAVTEYCMEVATHRHGCCVLQRCMDHASVEQKEQLVHEIVRNALLLVQDPFGNYVVQYVLDLGNSVYTEMIITQFSNNVCLLSVQKFSSNVIEKCIRVASPPLKRLLIKEIAVPANMERLLKDSYANYVVQTALDNADLSLRSTLIASMKPILPSIRNTPYGKRLYNNLHSKIYRDL